MDLRGESKLKAVIDQTQSIQGVFQTMQPRTSTATESKLMEASCHDK
jgi:hypothetical protein